MSDAEYLIARAQQELRAAMRAPDARVRQIHLELADAYSFRLRQMKRDFRPKVGLVSRDRGLAVHNVRFGEADIPLMAGMSGSTNP
jgi:hypothetical protein